MITLHKIRAMETALKALVSDSDFSNEDVQFVIELAAKAVTLFNFKSSRKWRQISQVPGVEICDDYFMPGIKILRSAEIDDVQLGQSLRRIANYIEGK